MRPVYIIASVILFLAVLTSCSIGTNSIPPISGEKDPTPPVSSEPLLSVSPSLLNFAENESTATLRIINDGSGLLCWEIETEYVWIKYVAAEGETENETTVDVSINRKEITDPKPLCEGTMDVYSNGGNITIPVVVCISGTTMTVFGSVYGEQGPDTVPLHGATINLYREGEIITTGQTDQAGMYIIADVPQSCDYIEAQMDGYYSRIEKLMKPNDGTAEHSFVLQKIPDGS